MDFGQDLEPEELTKHYDRCYNPEGFKDNDL